MVPLAIIWKIRFPVEYSCCRGIRSRSGGTFQNAQAAYIYQLEANGSATYLTNMNQTAPDAGAGDNFKPEPRFPNRAIFLAVGAMQCRPGGTIRCRAAYLYQLEANGSATYLTKVTAENGAKNKPGDLIYVY